MNEFTTSTGTALIFCFAIVLSVLAASDYPLLSSNLSLMNYIKKYIMPMLKNDDPLVQSKIVNYQLLYL